MNLISVVNQKGGAGKTTTTVNLGAVAAQRGKKVLLIDLDPQGSLTLALGKSFTQDDVFTGSADPVRTRVEGMDLIPSGGLNLSRLEVKFREKHLLSQLREVMGYYDEYDLGLVDCPPDVNALTQNGIVAADQLLIPCRISFDVYQIDATVSTIEMVRQLGFPVTGALAGVSTQLQRLAVEKKAHEHVCRKYGFWTETPIRMSAIYTRAVFNGRWLPAACIGSKGSAPIVDHTALAGELGLIESSELRERELHVSQR